MLWTSCVLGLAVFQWNRLCNANLLAWSHKWTNLRANLYLWGKVKYLSVSSCWLPLHLSFLYSCYTSNRKWPSKFRSPVDSIGRNVLFPTQPFPGLHSEPADHWGSQVYFTRLLFLYVIQQYYICLYTDLFQEMYV